MIKKICVFIVFMVLIILPNTTEAKLKNNETTNIPVISDLYKAGLYHFDINYPTNVIIRLTNDIPTAIMVLDNEMNISLLTKVPYNNQFKLVTLKPGEIIGIVGGGEIAISFESVK